MIVTGQFNDSLPPIMDGVSVTAVNYAYWLSRNHAPSFTLGPRVPNVPTGDEPTFRYGSVRTLIADPYRLGLPWADREFHRAVENVPFDLVHAHCPFVSGRYALNLAKRRNIPLVATFHSKYREDFRSWLHSEFAVARVVGRVAQFYEQADVVWVPNKAIVDTLREYGYRGEVDYVPNGSDLSPETTDGHRKSLERGLDLLQVDRKRPVLLYVGQHRWIKNLRLLIDSLVHLRGEGVPFQMRFVGEGPEAPELRQLVKNRGLGNAVKFIGALHEREDIKAIYGTADLFLFPSLYDNASLAIREAAGFAVPTLFVRGATTANGIIDGVNGFLAPDIPRDYGKKIAELLKDPESVAAAGQGARETLYRSWEEIVSTVYDKYREIIDEYKRRKIDSVVRRERRQAVSRTA